VGRRYHRRTAADRPHSPVTVSLDNSRIGHPFPWIRRAWSVESGDLRCGGEEMSGSVRVSLQRRFAHGREGYGSRAR
jgi:hypothetical protein